MGLVGLRFRWGTVALPRGSLPPAPPRAMVARGVGIHAADDSARLLVSELGAPGGGAAGAAGAAAVSGPLLAGAGLGLRLGAAVPSGFAALHGAAAAACRLSATEPPSLRAGRRRRPLGAVPADAHARLGGAGDAAGHSSAGLARPPELPAAVQGPRRRPLDLAGGAQGAPRGAGLAGRAHSRRGPAAGLMGAGGALLPGPPAGLRPGVGSAAPDLHRVWAAAKCCRRLLCY